MTFKAITKLLGALIIIIAIIFYRYGRSRYEKLGETTFLKNKTVEIKIITRHEYLPLHYSGDAYSIACKSDQTSNFKEQKSIFVEEGWSTIPSLAFKCDVADSIKCDHQKLSEKAKKYINAFENSTVTSVTEDGVYVSFNGCQSFVHWNTSLINNESPNLKIFISNIQASDKGTISFSITPKTLKNDSVLYVESLDFGKTWKTKTVKTEF
ncbi:hypothetical protein DOM21_14735 [Bacteriovorax stolpii]|uniref:hypothetical protein n=1 Tax=Bacteriovorax stolpii TaxID=960 RepID=UPI00115BAA90|nr:hypothetical protein [Bacteriovorax stolpii]QDK42682.1 hypothetical protein DOM21_14735 [Bacteriovorax stolpii]